MSIKFDCPKCKKILKVKDELAGKKAKCPACQQILQIPQAVPAPAGPDLEAMAEALAAAALIDQPKPPPLPDSNKTIDFQCPFCDEQIHFGIDLGGKQAPCPECRRIIKVPMPVKVEPKDWRKVDTRNPLAALRKDEPPPPDGAWGSAVSRGNVSREALIEADAVPIIKEPWTARQKVNRALAGTIAIALLATGVWSVLHFTFEARKNKAFRKAEESLQVEEGKPALDALAAAEIQRAMGEYFLRGGKPGVQPAKEKTTAELARDAFRNARGYLADDPNPSTEHDALAIDLALSQVELGGDAEQVRTGTRIKWDDVARELTQTLARVNSTEARLEGLREVERKLLARGPWQNAGSVPAGVLDADDPARPEALAQLGLLLLIDQKDQANEQANQAMQPFEKTGDDDEKQAQVPPSLIALLFALDRAKEAQELAPTIGREIEPEIRTGHAQGLAYQGKLDEARDVAKKGRTAGQKLQAALAVATAVADTGGDPGPDINYAVSLVDEARKDKSVSSWLFWKLARVGVRTGQSAAVAVVPDLIPDSSLRSRAKLALTVANQKKSDMDALAGALEEKPIHPPTLVALARLNTRHGSTSTVMKAVDAWEPQILRPLGYIGIALGLQDTEFKN